MLKKILLIIILFFSFGGNFIYAQDIPTMNCIGLPGCKDSKIEEPSPAKYKNMVDGGGVAYNVTTEIITMLIQYTAVIAVISVMISGMMYLVSFGEEEKIKKAKSWIMWSLGGVFISISAWGIVNIINNIQIGLSGL